jgi:hypothetical protein
MLCRGSTRLPAGGETTTAAHRYQPDSPRPALLVTLSQSSFDGGSDCLSRPPAARRGRPRVAPLRCRRPSELTIASATPPVSGLRALRRHSDRRASGSRASQRGLGAGAAEPTLHMQMVDLHGSSRALLSATDESQGAGQNNFRGSDRSGGRSHGLERASCGLGSTRRDGAGSVFAGICVGDIVAGVVGVGTRG